jgi:hypothetical protein
VLSCHSERSEESLIICVSSLTAATRDVSLAQHDKSLNPIHGAAASNVQSNHERSTNFRQKPKWLASLKERIQRYE